jgi:hypothetical protein
MFTLEITYNLDIEKPKESALIVQYIKNTLSDIIWEYSQTTDSVTKAGKYTFSTKTSSQAASTIRRWLKIIPKDQLSRINIIKK